MIGVHCVKVGNVTTGRVAAIVRQASQESSVMKLVLR